MPDKGLLKALAGPQSYSPLGGLDMRNLLLPPIVWISAVAGIFVTHAYLPIAHVEPTLWRSAIGMCLIVAALALTASHKRLFRKAGTNVNTFDDPDKLVEAGLFKYIRNPMYLGFAASLTGLALLLGAVSPWFIALGFFILTDRWYIPFEERAMLARFGDQYRDYRARTRRWI